MVIYMKSMKIFEPAMCCSTGLCGVSVDPELLRISTVLNSLNKNGITVERYNLSNAPQEFVSNKVINQLINEKGVEELPVTVLDETIVIAGRYPSNDDFIKLLGIPESYLGEAKSCEGTADMEEESKTEGCCCCSDGNCC
jgi:hypothetical protein